MYTGGFLYLHVMLGRSIIRPMGFQVHVISVRPIDDVIVWIAALADQTVAFKADVHIARNQLGPFFEIGFEDRLEGVRIGKFDDASRLAIRALRRDFFPRQA